MIKTLAISAVVLAVAIVGGILHFADAEPVVTFVVCGIALGGVAWTIGIATESVGARFGPAVTGALQSTLGNLPELFIVLFALSAGELVVAQFSILGSLFANALLVLGLAIAAGSAKRADGTMTFGKRLPNDTATLLLLAVFLISILGLSDQVGDAASHHQYEISVVGAVCLLVVYGAWLFGYLRSDQSSEASLSEPSHAALPFKLAVVLLAVSGVLAALVSDWFVDALDPAVEALGISKAFTGLVIVAIAGNAVENVVGVQLAWKGQNDLAISVVKNSVAQIACFLWPVLVLASFFFTNRLTFVVEPVYLGALALTAIAALAGDRRRAGRPLRGPCAGQPLRGARDARLVRVAIRARRDGGGRAPRRGSARASPRVGACPARGPRSARGGAGRPGGPPPRACAAAGGCGPRGARPRSATARAG